MAEQAVPAALQAHRTAMAEAAAAVDKEYPKFVCPDRAAWLNAKTPEERRAAKVLVFNEAEHRIAAPHDFIKHGKGEK